MAFFSDGASSYMSLSLAPAASRKAYVFRMTQRQLAVASRALPSCVAASTIALLLIAGVGVLAKLQLVGGWLNGTLQQDIVVFLAASGSAVAFSEGFFFLWVRFSPASLLSEGNRRRLGHLALYRRLSWMAYAAFLFSLLCPFLGLLALPDGAGWDPGTSGFGGYFYVTQVGLLAVLTSVFLVRRILRILAWKDLTNVGEQRVAQQ